MFSYVYKNFSYTDLSLFVHFTALLMSLTSLSLARWLLMMKWRRFQKTCIYCCMSLEETRLSSRCTDWARRCIFEWNWFESQHWQESNFLRTFKIDSGVHPAFYSVGTGSPPSRGDRNVKLTICSDLVVEWWMSAAKASLAMSYTGTTLAYNSHIFIGFSICTWSSALLLNLTGRCSALRRPTW